MLTLPEKRTIMEDKMVELTRFLQASEAEMLASLLQGEGIDCYVRDSFISDIYKGVVDLGGAKIELLEKDLQRAKEIMKDFGYDDTGMKTPVSSEEPKIIEDEEVTETNIIEFQKHKAKLSRTLTIFLVLILLVLVLIIVLNKYFNG